MYDKGNLAAPLMHVTCVLVDKNAGPYSASVILSFRRHYAQQGLFMYAFQSAGVSHPVVIAWLDGLLTIETLQSVCLMLQHMLLKMAVQSTLVIVLLLV